MVRLFLVGPDGTGIRTAVDPLGKAEMQEWINRHPLEFGYSFFLALWVAVIVLISYVSGWRALAQRFRSSTGFVGQKWRGQSAQMRGIGGYNHCLTVGANRD